MNHLGSFLRLESRSLVAALLGISAALPTPSSPRSPNSIEVQNGVIDLPRRCLIVARHRRRGEIAAREASSGVAAMAAPYWATPRRPYARAATIGESDRLAGRLSARVSQLTLAVTALTGCATLLENGALAMLELREAEALGAVGRSE
jgi:hypothetical protein